MVNDSSRPLLLGHRGVRPLRRFGFRRPVQVLPAENTIEAFDYAIACGCDGFEFDVRFTSDRRAAVYHDPKFRGQEIANVDHASLQRHTGPVACLDEVLARFGGSAYLDIEVKVGGQEEAIVAALKASPPMRGYVVSSFVPGVLRRLYELDASLHLGYVCERADVVKQWSTLPISIFIPQYKLVSQSVVEEVHSAGLKLFTWTVNHQRDLVRLAHWGVDGLISDDPKLLCRTFLQAD